MLKYTIEASVIIVGILFSFYIEEIRSNNRDIEVKNELLSDLNRALERDLDQINEIQKKSMRDQRKSKGINERSMEF